MSDENEKNKHGRGMSSVIDDVTRWIPELRRFLRRKRCRHQDLDDVVQEIYVRLLKRGFHDVRDRKGFLFGVAKNVLAAHRSDSGAESQTRSLLAAENEREEESANAFADYLMEQFSIEQDLHKTLSKLPKTHADVCLLCAQKCSYSEIAKKLGISIDTVKKYLAEVRRQFRENHFER